tara:strand:- start:353 stop:880 length:528 start_codon:yes stop_codon:yes gene_type:complete
MNNLKGMRTYLVGAMDRVADRGVTWRNSITPMLEDMHIKVLDPCKKVMNGKREDEDTKKQIEYYKETQQFDKIRENWSYIRNADLRCVDVSDFIIANINMNVHMCGSYEEISTANRQKKPVLVWCEQGKTQAPNWLFFMIPHQHIFSTMDQLVEYLYTINRKKNVSDLERWFFYG